MFKKIGRLDNEAIYEIETELREFFEMLDGKDKDLAEKKIVDIAKTPNYFIREEIGRLLPKYHDQRRILPLFRKLLKHKFYGVKATSLFYFYNRYIDDPDKILEILETTYDSIPWETESIINELWKKYPQLMKREMPKWYQSGEEQKRSLAFHGIENVAESDPDFIMDFVNLAIGDESEEVQKKLAHILTQVARNNPAEIYPNIREWLISADNQRVKTIWGAMKKLTNFVNFKAKKDSDPFSALTIQTIHDWRQDHHKNVSFVGKKLHEHIKKK